MPVSLKEALSIIESGEYCSLQFITADVKKGTGGKVIKIPRCRLCRSKNLNFEENTETIAAGSSSSGPVAKRFPNHNLHFTRNMELPNKQIRKVHPILIFNINSQDVL